MFEAGRAVGHVLAARPYFWWRDRLALARYPVIADAHRLLVARRRALRWDDDETRAAVRAAGLAEEAGTFGETPLCVAIDLLSFAGVSADSTVVDLGAGTGGVLMAARALGAAARGVELSRSRVRCGAPAMELCGAQLAQGDARTAALDGATHVVLAWTTWPASLRAQIAERLPAHAITVVAMTHPVDARTAHVERVRMPWGGVDVVLSGGALAAASRSIAG